jgi:long-chain acyl-CoA synthetase
MKLATENKLNSLEKPKQIQLLLDPWTVDNDFLTPTFKMKRNIAKIKLQEDITRMYGESLMKETKK